MPTLTPVFAIEDGEIDGKLKKVRQQNAGLFYKQRVNLRMVDDRSDLGRIDAYLFTSLTPTLKGYNPVYQSK